MTKIYLASSWKNEIMVKKISKYLRDQGFEVDNFTDSSKGRFVFSFDKLPNVEQLNAKTVLDYEVVQRAFHEDKKWIDWADCVLMILPCGKSAHLEAGYAKGCGKKLIIYSFTEFPKGEFDVMYGFVDLITTELPEIVKFLKNVEVI